MCAGFESRVREAVEALQGGRLYGGTALCRGGRPGSSPFAEIEHIAIRAAIILEEARGCRVESVESDARGFDLVSRRFRTGDSREQIETRFIEVKGRAGVGEIALTANEYRAAQSLGDEYWLYVVFNCASEPQVTAIQNPARLEWEALSKIDCYRIGAEGLLQGTS